MADRVIRNVENDYLMCSICLGRYRDPRLLPCGHTFCKPCLEEHIKETVTDRSATFFTCPNDRTQVTRPAPGLPPREWASAFPADTFLGSLLNAVMMHASQSEGQSNVTCEAHKGRVKEFYCSSCNVVACPVCVVKNHKGRACECVTIDEAVEKLRPRMENLRLKLQRQVQRARQVSRGENPGEEALKRCKDGAFRELGDLETKLTFFYSTAMQQLTEMREVIREAGNAQMPESEQISLVVEHIDDTINKYDEICNHGSGVDILTVLPQTEKQALQYDAALKTIGASPHPIQIQFSVNRDMEETFENIPVLACVRVTSGQEAVTAPRFLSETPPPVSTPRFLSNNPNFTVPSASASAYMFNMAPPLVDMASPRAVPHAPHLVRRHSGETPRISDRSPRVTGNVLRRSRSGQVTERIPRTQRNKLSFSVRDAHESTSCWQLTGITLINDYVVITDAHNNRLRRSSFTGSMSVRQQMPLDCPVCVARLGDTADVIVTLPEKKQIVSIDTETGLTVKEHIDTPKPYEGVCYLQESRLVVSCCVLGCISIDIIDLQGQILKTFNTNNSGQPLFSWPRFLSSATSGNILVSDRDQNALVCLDQNGAIKWRYNAPASPWGVSQHENGNIFLSLDNGTVHVVSQNGRLVQDDFITGMDGVTGPYAISAHGEYVAVTEWGTSLFAPNSHWVHVFSM